MKPVNVPNGYQCMNSLSRGKYLAQALNTAMGKQMLAQAMVQPLRGYYRRKYMICG